MAGRGVEARGRMAWRQRAIGGGARASATWVRIETLRGAAVDGNPAGKAGDRGPALQAA